MSINVCIFGVSGYTGSKLLYYLDKHPNVNVAGAFGDSSAGKTLGEVFPNLQNCSDIKITDFKKFNFNKIDLIFSCLPHGMFQESVIKMLNPKIAIIDLSGDFRLDSKKDYENFYNCIHKSMKLQNKFAYGLTEVNRENIKKSKFISNPGCYPTSILIPIIPLLKEKSLKIDDFIIDSKSGVSGAGKKAITQNLFSELSGNFFAYGINKHKHYPEIKQEIDTINNKVSLTFTPHLLPIISGIQSTIYFEKKKKLSEYKNVLKEFYQNEYFIKILKDSDIPTLNNVKNSNYLHMNIFSDQSKKRIIIVSCIDNLVKGAAGQAIQNMNLMFDFNEQESLT